METRYLRITTPYHSEQKLTRHQILLHGIILRERGDKVDEYMDYIIGDEVEVKITGIRDFGAFCETADNVKGLIHISQIQNKLIANINDYFKVGDVVKGVVKAIDEMGKLGISTIGYDLPDYFGEEEHSVMTKLYQLKNKLEESPIKEEKEPLKYSVEMKEISGHIETIIGEELSERAQNNIRRNIDKYGVFKYTLAMAKKQHFVIDKGVAFNHLLEEELNLNIRYNHYTVSEHAVEQWCGKRFGETNRLEKAKEEILHHVANGVFLSRRDDHIYIRNAELVFPCLHEYNNNYVIKTVLTTELYYHQLNQTYKKP